MHPVDQAITFPVAVSSLPAGDYAVTIQCPEEHERGCSRMAGDETGGTAKADGDGGCGGTGKAVAALREPQGPLSTTRAFAYALDSAANDLLKKLLDPDPAIAFQTMGMLQNVLFCRRSSARCW